MPDELDLLGPYDARFVQPYQATKRYVCPACHRDIAPGTGHYVVVPREAPDLRRHWHRGCFERRQERAAGAPVKKRSR